MAKEIKIKYVPLDKLVPYANNPRRNDKAVGAVTNSIQEFGFLNPIIVDQDYIIIAGHTRFLAAQRLHMEQVPVIVADDLNPLQVEAFRLADNKTSEIATWNKDLLAEELAELIGVFDMTKFGFKSDAEELREAVSEKKKHKCPRCGYEW